MRLAAAFDLQALQIHQELIDVQGSAVDLGGYFRPDPVLASAAMRPSATLNELIASI